MDEIRAQIEQRLAKMGYTIDSFDPASYEDFVTKVGTAYQSGVNQGNQERLKGNLQPGQAERLQQQEHARRAGLADISGEEGPGAGKQALVSGLVAATELPGLNKFPFVKRAQEQGEEYLNQAEAPSPFAQTAGTLAGVAAPTAGVGAAAELGVNTALKGAARLLPATAARGAQLAEFLAKIGGKIGPNTAELARAIPKAAVKGEAFQAMNDPQSLGTMQGQGMAALMAAGSAAGTAGQATAATRAAKLVDNLKAKPPVDLGPQAPAPVDPLATPAWTRQGNEVTTQDPFFPEGPQTLSSRRAPPAQPAVPHVEPSMESGPSVPLSPFGPGPGPVHNVYGQPIRQGFEETHVPDFLRNIENPGTADVLSGIYDDMGLNQSKAQMGGAPPKGAGFQAAEAARAKRGKRGRRARKTSGAAEPSGTE